MKKILFKTILFCVCITNYAQNLGDIAFVGFNADGDKDFAIVALADLPANTTFYFTDSEPNETGTGIVSNAEGVIDWNTGSSIITAGTVITFTDVETTLTASVGTAVDSSIDTGFNLSAAGDNIFVTMGNPATNNVSKWLAGIEFRNIGQSTNFFVTGLSVGDTYVVINDSASKDGGEYSGTRTEVTALNLRSLIANENNWITETSDGELVLPFNTSSFQITSLSKPYTIIEGIDVVYKEGSFIVNKGQIHKILSLTGKEIENSNLPTGIYLVLVSYLNKFGMYKLLIP